MTERELQEHVRTICAQLGLYHYHTHDSRRSQRGFPDSFIMHRRSGRILFAELKTQTGQLSSEQKAVSYSLIAGGHDWRLWRPAELTSGHIARTLAEMTRETINR